MGVFWEREAGQEQGLHITARVNTSQGVRCRAVADALPPMSSGRNRLWRTPTSISSHGRRYNEAPASVPPGAGTASAQPHDLAHRSSDRHLPRSRTRLYKPAIASTMLSMYLANPALAGGAAGGILFGLLTVYELDRAGRSRVEVLTNAVVSPLAAALVRLPALLAAAGLALVLTMLVWLPISCG